MGIQPIYTGILQVYMSIHKHMYVYMGILGFIYYKYISIHGYTPV